jgi:glucose-6-phosphate dehydrogenase assembly protein OpcA
MPPQIAPSQISAELKRVWSSDEGKKALKAHLFNLIFYTRKSDRTAYIQTIAQKIIAKFPSRIFVIVADEKKEGELATSVSLIHSSKGEYAIACDLIQFEGSGDKLQRIPFIILPHLITDLPIYLIWGEDPSLNNPLLAQLEPFVNRLIFDSECAENLPAFAKSVLGHGEAAHCDIADLNWARCESWRDLLTDLFASEERLTALRKVKSVRLSYNSCESAFFCRTAIQAIYLQSWMACQLGWKLDKIKNEKEKASYLYTAPQGPVEVILEATCSKELAPGIVISIDLTTQDEMLFSLSRNVHDMTEVDVHISTKEKCELPSQFIFAKTESGSSLVKEICHRGTSKHYLKLLNAIEKYAC